MGCSGIFNENFGFGPVMQNNNYNQNYNNYNNNYNNYNNNYNNYNNYNNNNKNNIPSRYVIIENDDGTTQMIPKWDYYEYKRRERVKNRKKITSDGYLKGIKLCGRVRVVERDADFKVTLVNNGPDLRVEKVDRYPNKIGEWQFVDNNPDFTIQYVDGFSYFDLSIEFVNNYPGIP